MRYSIHQISEITQGVAQDKNSDAIITGVLTDSRNFVGQKSVIFVALVGPNRDGHDYIAALANKGVAHFMVQYIPEGVDANFIIVKDTLRGLQAWASFHRSTFQKPILAITGSNGKTTVKEWLYQTLQENMRVFRSPRSYNSQLGVALSLLMLDNDLHDVAIIEAGISQKDEMAYLKKMIQPDWALFTNIGSAHDEGFENRSTKAKEKALLAQGAKKVFCSDHFFDLYKAVKKRSKNLLVWSYTKENAQLIVKNIHRGENDTRVSTQYGELKIPFTDKGSIENCLLIYLVLKELNFTHSEIFEKIKKLDSIEMRLEVKKGIQNCSLINDSYNSDIQSLKIAVEYLMHQNQHAKKVLILSDLDQLGVEEDLLYKEVADMLNIRKVDVFIGIGEKLNKYQHYFRFTSTYFFANVAEFLKRNISFLDSAVLIKGARKFRFEQISWFYQKSFHQTTLNIYLERLTQNLNVFRKQIAREVKLMVMVKSFSYGAGIVEIGNILQNQGVDYLGVAYTDEAIILRQNGISLPIMIMNCNPEEMYKILMHDLEPEIHSWNQLQALEKLNMLEAEEKKFLIHIKVDTGMHRLGFQPDELPKVVERIQGMNGIRVKSILSHLVGSDNENLDSFSENQISTFFELAQKFENELGYSVIKHIANSSGIMRFPSSHGEMVRLGIGLYGVGNFEELQPVHELKSRISEVRKVLKGDSVGYNRAHICQRDSLIGIIPIGYGDGMHRILSNGIGHVMVQGTLVPIVGNVCMDMTMVDLTDLDVSAGDEVEIFGLNRPIADLADEMQTIPYEVLTSLSARVRRVYYY